MRMRNDNYKIVAERFEKFVKPLGELGFEPDHQLRFRHTIFDCEYDFSAIGDEFVIPRAVWTIHESGIKKGKNQIRKNFLALMEIEDDE